jgi:hypothetical protein
MASEYQHRTNPDGTIDSICPYCYATIGNAHWETDLELMEADHICDPARVALYEDGGSRAAKRPQHIESSRKIRPIRRVG